MFLRGAPTNNYSLFLRLLHLSCLFNSWHFDLIRFSCSLPHSYFFFHVIYFYSPHPNLHSLSANLSFHFLTTFPLILFSFVYSSLMSFSHRIVFRSRVDSSFLDSHLYLFFMSELLSVLPSCLPFALLYSPLPPSPSHVSSSRHAKTGNGWGLGWKGLFIPFFSVFLAFRADQVPLKLNINSLPESFIWLPEALNIC